MRRTGRILFATIWAAVVTATATDPAFARCKDYVPGPKPQNTWSRDVGQDYDTIIDRGFVTFGVYEAFPPYSFKQKGKLTGVDVDMGRLIAEHLGVAARFRSYQAGEKVEDDLRNNVWKGHYIGGAVVNVMMHAPYDTDLACRNEQVVLTGQYYNETLAIAYRTDVYEEDDKPSPAYFRYDKVGVETDSLPSHYLARFAGGQVLKNLVHYQSPELAMTALADGDLAAVMGLRPQLEFGATDRIKVHRPGLPGLAKQEWTIGVAVRHTYRQLGYAVGDAVRAGVEDGRVKAIFDKYGLTWTPPNW